MKSIKNVDKNMEYGTSFQGSKASYKDDLKIMDEESINKDLTIFRENVHQYENINNLIKEINVVMKPLRMNLKELNIEKKRLQLDLCRFMGSYNVSTCNLPIKNETEKPQALKYAKSMLMTPLTKSLQDMLFDFFESTQDILGQMNPEERAEACFEFISDKNNRPRYIKESIRKVKYVKNEKIDYADDDSI